MNKARSALWIVTTLFLVIQTSAKAESPSSLAPQRTPRVDVFGSVGFLTNADAHGSALVAGTRLRFGPHFALSFDIGYGIIGSSTTVQDRWWLIPSAAVVLPIGPLELDLGFGLGLGTSSGYSDMGEFAREPFNPDWAFQLAPTARAHAIASVPLNADTTAFLRLDVATLLLEGNTIGLRDLNPQPSAMDPIWINVAVGFSFRAL